MNRLIRAGALSLAVAGLAACSSMSGSVAKAPPAPEYGPKQGAIVTDQAYMAYVEKVARQRGVDVWWVNPPTRREVAANE